MARTTQLTVTAENKVGMLARIANALRRAKVNVDAISVADAADVCAVRLVVSSTPKATAALKKVGLGVTRQAVLAVKMPNEPGALADAANQLARAKVNVNYVYGSAGKKGKAATVVFSVDNLAKAAKALK